MFSLYEKHGTLPEVGTLFDQVYKTHEIMSIIESVVEDNRKKIANRAKLKGRHGKHNNR